MLTLLGDCNTLCSILALLYSIVLCKFIRVYVFDCNGSGLLQMVKSVAFLVGRYWTQAEKPYIQLCFLCLFAGLLNMPAPGGISNLIHELPWLIIPLFLPCLLNIVLSAQYCSFCFIVKSYYCYFVKRCSWFPFLLKLWNISLFYVPPSIF